MRTRYGRFQPLRLPMEIKDPASLAEAYRWLIGEILGRRLNPRAVGPVLASLKRLQGLLPAGTESESSGDQAILAVLRRFLDEHPDIQGTYVTWLKKRRADANMEAAP